MPTARRRPTAIKAAHRQTVEFIVPRARGGVRAQLASPADVLQRPLADVKAEWESVFATLQELSASADKA